MKTYREIKKYPKSDHPRRENLQTQPLRKTQTFNNPEVITESWYPLCSSKKIRKNQCQSFSILRQRIVIFRGESGQAYALDAYCPHMGADLGNGHVIGERLQCYFHQWSFDSNGKTTRSGVDPKECLASYPVEEKYGFIWIYAGKKPTHSVPTPPGLEKVETSALHLKRGTLFAHHHVMMAGGIDIQHFKSVHDLDIDFQFHIDETAPDVYCWNMEGKIPTGSYLQRFARWLTGGLFRYQALFAGGTITTLNYGAGLSFRGHGHYLLPNVYILWGATPLLEGVSSVDIFFIVPKYKGLWAPIKRVFMYLFTFLLLVVLRDDDLKAFPNMRFQLGSLNKEDQSVIELAQRLDQLQISSWTGRQ